jgi:hypothetical protein
MSPATAPGTSPATHDAAPRTASRIPGYPVLIATIFGICVVGMSLSITAEIVFGYVGEGDQPRSLEEQLAGVVGFGTAGLLVSLLSVRFLSGSESRARVGAIVLGALSVPALAFFWCGMPALLGAAAARLAGLTRGTTPLGGAARVFGLVGLVLAVLNPTANFLAVTISWLSSIG